MQHVGIDRITKYNRKKINYTQNSLVTWNVVIETIKK